jgi:hypothetical protein
VSYVSGTSNRQLPIEEMSPRSGFPIVSVSRVLQEKYRFQATGQSARAQQVGTNFPAFQTGEFTFDKTPVPIAMLEFTSSDISVTCARTDISDMVIDDVLETLNTKLGFENRPSTRTKYSSVIIVETKVDIAKSFGKWNEIIDAIKEIGVSRQLDFEFVPLGIKIIGKSGENFFDDPNHSFTFETRLTSLNVNWQFTAAPFKSDEHLSLVERIENIFSEVQ